MKTHEAEAVVDSWDDEDEDELPATPQPQPVAHRPQGSSPAILGHMLAEVAATERPPLRSYATGFSQLDELIGGGLTTRQLTTLLGPPGAGKTAWCVALALRLHERVPVLYISTELEAEELAARVAAPIINVPWRDIVRGKVDRARLREALANLRIRVVGCDELPRGDAFEPQVSAVVRAMAKEHGAPPVVVIDYVQDLLRGGDERNLRARAGDVATGLRAMAQELDCAVLGVSSVPRGYYSARKQEELRAENDPSVYLAAAKESGDVDFASAVLLFLDVEGAGTLPYRLARIAVAKSRHGETGFAGARFFGATGRWESDARAVQAMGDETRAEERRAAIEAKEESKVLAVVRQLKARGFQDPVLGHTFLKSKSALAEGCGIQKARAIQAISRLIASGKLVDSTEGLYRKRKVIDVPPDPQDQAPEPPRPETAEPLLRPHA